MPVPGPPPHPRPPPKRSKKRFVDLELGPLPVDRINRALRLELEPGIVMLNTNHQVHVYRQRPDDYARLVPHIASIVANPLYAGDDGRNPDSFELIGRAHVVGEWVLLAIKFEPDADGRYQVASFYPVSAAKIEGRRQRGFLKGVAP